METLSITSKNPFSVAAIEGILSKDWRVETSPVNILVVYGARGRAYLHPDTELDYSGKYRLLLDYSDIDLAKGLIEKLANHADLIVDNDFGTVLPGNEFVARCKSIRGWDWRQTVIEEISCVADDDSKRM